MVASSCLGGEVRVWDCETGECLVVVDRQRWVVEGRGGGRGGSFGGVGREGVVGGCVETGLVV